jgi:hypothetical protein
MEMTRLAGRGRQDEVRHRGLPAHGKAGLGCGIVEAGWRGGRGRENQQEACSSLVPSVTFRRALASTSTTSRTIARLDRAVGGRAPTDDSGGLTSHTLSRLPTRAPPWCGCWVGAALRGQRRAPPPPHR